MPYKEGKVWRGVVTVGRKRIAQKTGFQKKSDAAKWEKDTLSYWVMIQTGMDLLTLSNKYLDHAERFGVKTFKEKKKVLVRISKEWGEHTPVASVTPDMAEQYILSQKKARSNNAANKDLKNLRSIWNKGIKTYGLKVNPWNFVDRLPHDVEKQPTYTEIEVLQILTAASREETLILRTFLESAGRRNEVWRLSWDDVNIEKQEICMWTRKTADGSKIGEWLPVSNELATEFKWWFDNRPMKESVFVFPNTRTGYPYIDPRKWLNRICDRAKTRNLGFHAFRRYVASILLDKHKLSRKAVQKLLRHKRELTTERYIRQIHTDLESIAGLAMPIPEMIPEKKEKGSGNEP